MATEETRDENKEKSFNSNSQNEGNKKKRPRVGDVRSTSGRDAGPSQGRTPYRNNSSDSDSGYRSNNNYAPRQNNNYDGGGYSNNRGNYSNDRGGYNNNRGNNSYNNSGGYSNNRGNYNNNRSENPNNREGYSNNRGGGNYSSGGEQGNRRPYGNNQGGGGYNRNNQGGNRGNSYGNNGGNRNFNRPAGRNNNRPQRPGLPKNDRVIHKTKHLIKPVKYKENIDPDTDIRLNKYLANAGVCSRREADTFIESGVVKVNGVVISELGAKVKRGDKVTFQDKEVSLESKVYVLLNKPKNCVTTSDDPQNRMTVMDLVKNACPERIYPVGRLDRNTTGVLLLTNDGDLASKLMHPKYLKKKIYQVKLDKPVTIEDMQAIADGVMLDDGEIHADSIAYVAEDVLDEIGIEIHSGRNRIVRRIFEKLGYQVIKLDRVYFAGLTKKNLPRGRWRYLVESEVNMLRMGAFE